jgi:hypothetical protein
VAVGVTQDVFLPETRAPEGFATSAGPSNHPFRITSFLVQCGRKGVATSSSTPYTSPRPEEYFRLSLTTLLQWPQNSVWCTKAVSVSSSGASCDGCVCGSSCRLSVGGTYHVSFWLLPIIGVNCTVGTEVGNSMAHM